MNSSGVKQVNNDKNKIGQDDLLAENEIIYRKLDLLRPKEKNLNSTTELES